jgi:hypothetical protein
VGKKVLLGVLLVMALITTAIPVSALTLSAPQQVNEGDQFTVSVSDSISFTPSTVRGALVSYHIEFDQDKLSIINIQINDSFNNTLPENSSVSISGNTVSIAINGSIDYSGEIFRVVFNAKSAGTANIAVNCLPIFAIICVSQ